jgi:hypothetical protein
MNRIALGIGIALSVACSGSSESSTSSGSETTTTTEISPDRETTTTTTTTTTETVEGPRCGTRGAAACAAGTFCDYLAGSNCAAADEGGICRPIPEMCTREYAPVCGCDGQTHPTACTAHSAGVSVAHDGPC